MLKLHSKLKPSFIFNELSERELRNINRENGYKTRQREAILEYLKKENRCVSADEIINALGASKATAYRSLERFVSEGSVQRFSGDVGESAVYRYNKSHSGHFHLKCTSCGKTVCADCGFIKQMEEHFMAHHGFGLSKSQTVFYGVCSDCR